MFICGNSKWYIRQVGKLIKNLHFKMFNSSCKFNSLILGNSLENGHCIGKKGIQDSNQHTNGIYETFWVEQSTFHLIDPGSKLDKLHYVYIYFLNK